MTRQLLVLAGLVSIAGGCEGFGQYDGRTSSAKIEKAMAMQGAPAIQYQEVPYEGRIYVVSTAKAAADVQKGTHPPTAVTKIGAGPNRETVVFEANKAYVEDALMAEWANRHGALKR